MCKGELILTDMVVHKCSGFISLVTGYLKTNKWDRSFCVSLLHLTQLKIGEEEERQIKKCSENRMNDFLNFKPKY